MQLYNHLTKKFYTFDFETWFSFFDDGSSEMKAWKTRLIYAYYAVSLRNETNGCFQYALQLNNSTLLLHLDIGHILKHSYQKNDIIQLKLTNIGTKYTNKGIVFFPTEKNSFKHLISTKPVILMKFPTVSGMRYLVVDGNHRITAKKSFHMLNINSLIYLTNSEFDFANMFEYTIYNFLIANYKF